MSPSTTAKTYEESSQMEAQVKLEVSQIPKEKIVTKVKNFKIALGTYSGDMMNGKRHGEGVYVDFCTRYIGSWVENVQKGHGTLTWSDGNTYSGTFENNTLKGTAHKKINAALGDRDIHWLISRFDGEFDQNFKYKKGVATFVNGWTFHCDYNEKGKPQGNGMVKDCAGNVVFESEWRDGKCDNHWFHITSACSALIFNLLVIIFLCHFLYWGCDFKHQVTNQRMMASGMCGTYTGQIWHYNRQGLGVAVLIGQGVYNGSWENGFRHDHGVMKWEDPQSTNRGDLFVGEWRNNQMTSGVYTYLSGKVYTGDFVDNMYHGYGVLNYTDGSSYSGHFNKNWREGNGTSIAKNGEICVGEWQRDEKNGLFSCIDVRHPKVIFNGFINGERKIFGDKINVLVPYIFSIHTVYKDAKEISHYVTMFSQLKMPVYNVCFLF